MQQEQPRLSSKDARHEWRAPLSIDVERDRGRRFDVRGSDQVTQRAHHVAAATDEQATVVVGDLEQDLELAAIDARLDLDLIAILVRDHRLGHVLCEGAKLLPALVVIHLTTSSLVTPREEISPRSVDASNQNLER